jgi:predicted DCC family thiol-disulfide oxidoreductase YuxK
LSRPSGRSIEILPRAVVLYDRDCGFCRWAAERIRRWDARRELAFRAIQDPDADAWLSGMDESTRLATWHLVEPDGRVWSGGDAVAPLFRHFPGGSAPAAIAVRFPAVTHGAYRAVAGHRGRLGELVGRDACTVDPSRVPSSSRARASR